MKPNSNTRYHHTSPARGGPRGRARTAAALCSAETRDTDPESCDKAANTALNKKAPAEGEPGKHRSAGGWQVRRPELWPGLYFSLAELSSKSWAEDLAEAPRDSH